MYPCGTTFKVYIVFTIIKGVHTTTDTLTRFEDSDIFSTEPAAQKRPSCADACNPCANNEHINIHLKLLMRNEYENG